MDFWERVEEGVGRQSTTFRWIAEKVVHKNETTVSSWRANNTQPRAAEAVKIAMALHTTVEYWVDGEEGQEYVRDLVRREVLSHFKRDSLREFVAWIRPRELEAPLPDVDLEVEGDDLLLDGEPSLAFAPGLPASERSFIARTLEAAYRARRGDCLAHVVAVYDRGEAIAVDRFLKELRSKK